MKEIFVIRFGQEYFGIQEKRIGFFKLHSQHVSRFTTFNDAEATLKTFTFPQHCVGELFQIVKYYVYGG
jgi:hypothetical protein